MSELPPPREQVRRAIDHAWKPSQGLDELTDKILNDKDSYDAVRKVDPAVDDWEAEEALRVRIRILLGEPLRPWNQEKK